MRSGDWWKLFVAIAVPQIAGGIGAVFTTPQINTWYATLARPELSPPNWVFGPVWTTLFFLMGIAVFLVWRRGLLDGAVRLGLVAFGVQLVLNVLWSVFFFGLENPALALADLVALWIAIVATMFLFYRASRTAAYLLVPYICWVTFAGYLNLQFVLLN